MLSVILFLNDELDRSETALELLRKDQWNALWVNKFPSSPEKMLSVISFLNDETDRPETARNLL